jgi:hypothetical protein
MSIYLSNLSSLSFPLTHWNHQEAHHSYSRRFSRRPSQSPYLVLSCHGLVFQMGYRLPSSEISELVRTHLTLAASHFIPHIDI